MLVVRGLIGGLVQLVALAALLLIPAGTWHWSRAIYFLVLYGLVNSVSIFALARLAPASLRASDARAIGTCFRDSAMGPSAGGTNNFPVAAHAWTARYPAGIVLTWWGEAAQVSWTMHK